MGCKKLVGVLRSLLNRAPKHKLNKTQLIKLVFLCDYEHYETFGETITGLTYHCAELGPVAWAIPDQASEMEDVEHEYQSPASRGYYPEHTYTLKDAPQPTGLSDKEEATVARVARDWGGKTAKQLVRLVHGEPFSELLTEGAPIDFTRLNEDPLSDEAAQDAIVSDLALRQSVSRAEEQLRTQSQVQS